jgi:hypothetical protein
MYLLMIIAAAHTSVLLNGCKISCMARSLMVHCLKKKCGWLQSPTYV